MMLVPIANPSQDDPVGFCKGLNYGKNVLVYAARYM